MAFQTTTDRKVKRTRHVWQFRGQRDYKCVLCGAVTDRPPAAEDEAGWAPDRYEALTDAERALCPDPSRRTT